MPKKEVLPMSLAIKTRPVTFSQDAINTLKGFIFPVE